MKKIIKSDNLGNMYVNDVVVGYVEDLKSAEEMIKILNKKQRRIKENEYYYSIEDENYKLYKFE